MRPVAPFVLLDDARGHGGPARLYHNPVEILIARDAAEVAGVLEAVRRSGRHAAGYLAYEAAPGIDPTLAVRPAGEGPLAWFGLFDTVGEVDAAALLPDPRGAWIGPAAPIDIDRAGYDAAIARVLGWIAAGDIYQANLSFRAAARWAGDPLALYAQLRARSGAGYGAVVDTGDTVLLSLSPELFFTLDGNRITARPMKGTARRRPDAAADAAAAAALATDAKQRAENLMIVDLLRNDLSRVAAAGSVAVPALFEVESFPTIHQMTSTVTATLLAGHDAIDLLAAAFPCGSITGAPKRRATEVIAAVEATPRGAYTGAIGRIDADGDAAFNVAIRTLTLRRDDGSATLGLGSGVVADSDAGAEWDECLAKAAFLGDGTAPFDLIETMAFDPEEGLPRLEAHLARLGASADALGIVWDRHDARNELQAATFRLRRPARVRLLVSPRGALAVEVGAMPPPATAPLAVAVVPLPVDPSDLRLRHKTGARRFYDEARHAAGTDEVVFARPDGLLTEGSFTTLFVDRGDGILVTPPLGLGLLPGVLRAELIARGDAVEGTLTAADLAHGFRLGNALRGLMPARLAL
jgi:para-aminobenzoate synthetase/4-amino-4-deoxychorismate lyase